MKYFDGRETQIMQQSTPLQDSCTLQAITLSQTGEVQAIQQLEHVLVSADEANTRTFDCTKCAAQLMVRQSGLVGSASSCQLFLDYAEMRE